MLSPFTFAETVKKKEAGAPVEQSIGTPAFLDYMQSTLERGLLVFGHLPNTLAIAGIVLVVASGLTIVLLDERKRRLAPAASFSRIVPRALSYSIRASW